VADITLAGNLSAKTDASLTRASGNTCTVTGAVIIAAGTSAVLDQDLLASRLIVRGGASEGARTYLTIGQGDGGTDYGQLFKSLVASNWTPETGSINTAGYCTVKIYNSIIRTFGSGPCIGMYQLTTSQANCTAEIVDSQIHNYTTSTYSTLGDGQPMIPPNSKLLRCKFYGCAVVWINGNPTSDSKDVTVVTDVYAPILGCGVAGVTNPVILRKFTTDGLTVQQNPADLRVIDTKVTNRITNNWNPDTVATRYIRFGRTFGTAIVGVGSQVFSVLDKDKNVVGSQTVTGDAAVEVIWGTFAALVRPSPSKYILVADIPTKTSDSDWTVTNILPCTSYYWQWDKKIKSATLAAADLGLATDAALLPFNVTGVAEADFITGTEATAAALTNIAINSGAKTVTMTAVRTLQEIYNYTKTWLKTSASVYWYTDMMFDGTALTLTNSWSIVASLTTGGAYTYSGGSISGTSGVPTLAGGTLNIGAAGTYNFSSTGTLIVKPTPTAPGAYPLPGTHTGLLDLRNQAAHAITINLPSGTSYTTANNTGGAITVVLPVVSLTVTSNIAGSTLRIFTTGTQTVLASGTGTSLVFTHSSNTVDIEVMKAGYLPQRRAGLVLSGYSTEAFTLLSDPNYDAAHGLTYTTSASWSRSNNQLTVPTFGPSVRGVYSLMIDSFISQSSLYNTPFNLSMNGPTSLYFINGAEGASDASITNMTGGGVRYISVAGVVTARWYAILSLGVVAGSQVEYENVSGGTIYDARATGNVNELIKGYGDSTHGNFDRRDHLQFKVQRNGYRQAESDVLATYGLTTLDETIYVISLQMAAIDGLTLGDPGATGITITEYTASPFTFDVGDGDKDYSLVINDTGANSGGTILRYTNYNCSLDATLHGFDPFYLPEMVLDNGAAYETLRGILHNTPDTLVGVLVLRNGTTPHPDFTRFQADDGTYGVPPVVASATITNIVNGSKVLIRNLTQATETYLDVPGTSYSDTYLDGIGEYSAGDSVQVVIHRRGYDTFQTTVVASTSGWSVAADQAVCPVCAALGIDGSTVTGFEADYINDEVNVTVAANFNIGDMWAWWNYNLESDDGIRYFVGGITAIDQANFRVNASVVDIYLDNTTSTNLRQLDNRRFYRDDGLYPVKSSGGGGIDVVWRNTILLAETGVSGLTPEESSLLNSIPAIKSKTDSLSFTVPGQIDANIQYVNDVQVKGVGSESDPWNPT